LLLPGAAQFLVGDDTKSKAPTVGNKGKGVGGIKGKGVGGIFI
jgi:hypothetical protein